MLSYHPSVIRQYLSTTNPRGAEGGGGYRDELRARGSRRQHCPRRKLLAAAATAIRVLQNRSGTISSVTTSLLFLPSTFMVEVDGGFVDRFNPGHRLFVVVGRCCLRLEDWTALCIIPVPNEHQRHPAFLGSDTAPSVRMPCITM